MPGKSEPTQEVVGAPAPMPCVRSLLGWGEVCPLTHWTYEQLLTFLQHCSAENLFVLYMVLLLLPLNL